VASNLRVAIDWAKNGTFTDAFDDVTTRVRGGSAGRLEVEQGRDIGNPLPQVIVGRGQVELDNRDRRYSSKNAGSPLFGSVKPARPFDLQRTVPTVPSATVFPLWRGRTDDQAADPDPEQRTVTFGVVDVLQDLRGRKVSTAVGVKRGIRTGDAVGFLLDDIGWTAGRDLDPGVSVLPLWWEEGNDVFESIGRLLTSEGQPAMVAIGTDGTFIFRDRHHRLLDAVSSTSQATLRASGPLEPVLGKGWRSVESWSTIVNDVSVTLDVRQVGSLQQVWSSDQTYTVGIGINGTLDIPITADDPFTNPQPLVQGVPGSSTGDFTLVSGAGPVTIQVLASASQIGPSTILRITNSGANGATVTGLRLRAQPITVAKTVTVTASDSTSQAGYGVRSLPGSDGIGPWCSEYDAQAIATDLVNDRKDPLTQATARLVVGRTAAGTPSQSNARATAVLARQVSHRVTAVVPSEQINGDFFVEAIRHEIAGEEDHTVTFTLEQVPPTGAFPTGATVFRFDTAGQGFDQGKFGL
jgi:hypothetical protein